MDSWKEIALVAIGVIVGGIGGVIRGDWLGTRAAAAVKDQLEGQIATIRKEQERLEERLEKELKEFADRVEMAISKLGDKLEAVSRRLHDANSKITEALLRLGLEKQ